MSVAVNARPVVEMKTSNLPREPVECSDSEDDGTNEVSKIEESGDLYEMMKNCKISTDSKNVADENLETELSDKFSKVNLVVEEADGSTEVLPDKIKPYTACETQLDSTPELESRGPHRGVATQYIPTPNNGQFWNQDYNNCSFYSSNVSGKRRVDEFEEVPYKFRPQEETNNLNFLCGSPSGSPKRSNIEDASQLGVLPDFNEIDDLLTSLSEHSDKLMTNGQSKLATESVFDSDGYYSETSPINDTVYSPVGLDSPPPSNLSHLSEDSGFSSHGNQSPDNRYEIHSPHGGRMNIGSPRDTMGYPASSVAVINVPVTNVNKFDVESPMPEQCSDPFEDRKDELADLLSVLVKDIRDNEKDKDIKKNGENRDKTVNFTKQTDLNNYYYPNQTSQQKQIPVPVQGIVNGNINNNINKKPMTVFSSQSNQNMKIQPVGTVQQAAQRPPMVNPSIVNPPMVNPPKPPVSNTAPIPVTVMNCNPTAINNSINMPVPVSTGQILLISQNQPLVFVNPVPMPPKPRVIKPRVIKPKLPPVPGQNKSNCPIQNIIDSRVPTTATNFTQETTRNITSKKPNNNIPITTNTTKAVKQIKKNDDSKRLNYARRLVADMTCADLRYQDEEGDTYLHVAACKADKNLVQALLERLEREKLTGMIDVNNLKRQTALYCAVCGNNSEMVEIFINNGADVNSLAERNGAGNGFKEVTSALHIASANGKEYLDTLKILLKSKDLILNTANSDGLTALHCAVLCHNKTKDGTGYIDSTTVVETLIEHGADINAQDKKSGKTPLMYALESKHLALIHSVVKILNPEKRRTYLRTQSFDGNTAQKILDNIKMTLDHQTSQKIYELVMYPTK